jgi:hypothetical protein
MTTEILRNIMYRQADTERNPEREDRLATVGLVVLDEVLSTRVPDVWRLYPCWLCCCIQVSVSFVPTRCVSQLAGPNA